MCGVVAPMHNSSKQHPLDLVSGTWWPNLLDTICYTALSRPAASSTKHHHQPPQWTHNRLSTCVDYHDFPNLANDCLEDSPVIVDVHHLVTRRFLSDGGDVLEPDITGCKLFGNTRGIMHRSISKQCHSTTRCFLQRNRLMIYFSVLRCKNIRMYICPTYVWLTCFGTPMFLTAFNRLKNNKLRCSVPQGHCGTLPRTLSVLWFFLRSKPRVAILRRLQH